MICIAYELAPSAFLELPENTTEEEKEFLQKQLYLQLEIFRSLKKKEK